MTNQQINRFVKISWRRNMSLNTSSCCRLDCISHKWFSLRTFSTGTLNLLPLFQGKTNSCRGKVILPALATTRSDKVIWEAGGQLTGHVRWTSRCGREETRLWLGTQCHTNEAGALYHDIRLKNMVAKLMLSASTSTRSCLSWHQSWNELKILFLRFL